MPTRFFFVNITAELSDCWLKHNLFYTNIETVQWLLFSCLVHLSWPMLAQKHKEKIVCSSIERIVKLTFKTQLHNHTTFANNHSIQICCKLNDFNSKIQQKYTQKMCSANAIVTNKLCFCCFNVVYVFFFTCSACNCQLIVDFAALL